VEGHAVISHDVLASYAADAAREVEGVHDLVDAPRRDKGVRVLTKDAATKVELHIAVDWDAAAPDVAEEVQRRVADYLARTASLPQPSLVVDIVVAGLAPTTH
jgi:uncharacterized alkaline shock family protein YloU